MAGILELILKRISVRTYRNTEISENLKEEINHMVESKKEGPLGSHLRFKIVYLDQKERKEKRKLGTYGFISGAPAFIIGAVSLTETAMEDFGYCMEHIILGLTGLGLGTCWLGGTFNRSDFTAPMDLKDNEVMPAVTPVGFPAEKSRVFDRIVRNVAGSKHRKSWQELFFSANGASLSPLDPPSGTYPGDYSDYDAALEAVRLAPSASNKQPWRIVRDGSAGGWHFFLKGTPGYGQFGPNIRLQNVDMGISMCHFELSLREMGKTGVWRRVRPAILPQGLKYVATFYNGIN